MKYAFDKAEKTTTLIWFPVIQQVSLLLNIILMYYGIKYVYVICNLIGFVFLLRKLKFPGNCFFCLRSAYLVSVVLTSLLQLCFLPGKNIPQLIVGLTTYVLAPLFWLLLSLQIEDSEAFFKKLIYKLRYVVAVTSLLGIYQYFYSPSLWGVLDQLESRQIIWANETGLEEYAEFMRATSLWCSPQICGLFLALYIVAFFSFFKKDKMFFLFVIPMFICGVLTSNKSFLLNMLFLFFIKLKIRLPFKIIIFMVVVFGIVCVGKLMPDYALSRMFSVERIWQEEVEEGERISIYRDSLSQTSFLGNGIGDKQKRTDHEQVEVAESMLLQILYELGIIPFLLFVLIATRQFFFCSSETKLLVFLTCLSTVYVHAFSSIHMFLFYAVLFLDLSKKNPVRIRENGNEPTVQTENQRLLV